MTVPGASEATSAASAGAPLVNRALEPAWVRDGSRTTQNAYESALAFEQTLVEQLSQSLIAGSGLSGEAGQEGASEGEGPSGAADSQLSSLLPQALTSGVMQAGGLGLAAQMTRQLEGVHGSAHTHANGGTGAS